MSTATTPLKYADQITKVLKDYESYIAQDPRLAEERRREDETFHRNLTRKRRIEARCHILADELYNRLADSLTQEQRELLSTYTLLAGARKYDLFHKGNRSLFTWGIERAERLLKKS